MAATPTTTRMSTATTSGGRAGSVPVDTARPWKLPPPRTYIFINATVVDPVAAAVVPGQIVKISNGAVDSISSFVYTTDEATVVDLEGRYLCPGLIDCHVHVAAVPGVSQSLGAEAALLRQPWVCGQMLARGFTSVRDAGGAGIALRDAIEDDIFPGPRLFLCGKALAPTGSRGDADTHVGGPPCCGSESAALSVVTDGVDEVVRATREQIRQGAAFIKMMGSGGASASPTDRPSSAYFTRAEARAAHEVAASCGVHVTSHAYTPRAIKHAVDNGARGIEHGNFLDDPTAELMAERGVWLTPSLVAHEVATTSDRRPSLAATPGEESSEARSRSLLEAGLKSLGVAHKAGVSICHGSDLPGPLQGEQNREFALRARVLDAATVLRGATTNAARMLGQEARLGRVREGFAADLLVLGANPLEDAEVLAEPERWCLAVIKAGRVCVSRWDEMPEDVHRRAW
ncbi:hypothetical protein N3K66_007973 [Trichothecium roseum]|uniref:Uncharacterized protein n=1 Tax=Trichothecium roseum TaxID=47278 RepID=A0ACC0US63_9HYPO|nr:hypothetical protein N3K66_007973 [Trichothecium roseum]